MPQSKYWAVVPAAGVGRRMGGSLPKQYLQLNGRPVIQHTLRRLAGHARIEAVVVALAANDAWWTATPDVLTCVGGEQRCHSVLNALRELQRQGAAAHDWVLVHDAVRPLLRRDDIDRLIEAVGMDRNGGLLGLPVRDTMKRVGPGHCVVETVSRDGLWHALTPQMFTIGSLVTALERCLDEGQLVTDEAQAMERCGFAPKMVEGHADNIKITRADDLRLAERLVSHK